MQPTGEQYELGADGVRAVVTSVGGGLRSLQHDGRDLVAGFPADAPRPAHRGAVLAPWPHRLAQGRFTWRGGVYEVPVDDPERDVALHGLVHAVPWSLVRQEPGGLQLHTTVGEGSGWPGPIHLLVAYRVDDSGLTWSLTARNVGDRPVPYGCAVHPCLVAGEGTVDDWTLQLDASTCLTVDPHRLLPTGEAPVDGSGLDLRRPSSLRDRRLDHVFTDLAAGPDRLARATLTGLDGGGVSMTWNRTTLPWVHVQTADRPGTDLHRRGVAIGPMTCPPNALASGAGVIRLFPGQVHRAVWRIEGFPAEMP